MFAAPSSSLNRQPVSPRKTECANLPEILLVVVAFVMATVLLTWPLVLHLSTRAAQLGDYLLTTYIQAWVAHALATHPTQILNMNMLYPSRHVLAASENLIGNQLLFAPVYALTGNPILAANVVTLGSFVLCGFTMYLLVRTLTGQRTSAAIAGFIYAVPPPRLAQIGHAQLLSMQWMPLATLFLFLFLFKKRWSSLVAFCAFVLLQILCSLYLGYLAILVCIAFFCGIAIFRRDLLTLRALTGLLAGALAVSILLLPLLLPYHQFEKQGLLSPASALPTAIAASATPLASYLDNGGGMTSHIYRHLLAGFHTTSFDWEKLLFPGFLPVVLSLIAVSYCFYLALVHSPQMISQRLEELGGEMIPSLIAGSILLLVAAYILSLGPYLWIHGQPTRFRMPFFWLRRWVPGLGMFRVPARFGLLMSFGLALLAGLGSSVLLRCLAHWQWFRSRTFSTAFIAILILAMAVEFNSTPLVAFPVMTPGTVAPAYRFLAKLPPNNPVVEMPITLRGPVAEPGEQAKYMYASIFHWQPLVDGYTGYDPPQSVHLMRVATRLPLPTATVVLAGIGVRYVLLHWDKLSPAQREPWNHLPDHFGLDLTADFGDTRVYRIDPQQAALAAKEPFDPALCPSATSTVLDFIRTNPARLVANTMTNTGFEAGSLLPWHNFGTLSATITAAEAHSGSHSLAEDGGEGSVYADAQGLEPGRRYVVTAWALSTLGATATAQLALYDPSTGAATFSSTNSCGGGWQLLSLPITAGKLGKIRIHLFRNGGSGTIYWDDVAIYRQN